MGRKKGKQRGQYSSKAKKAQHVHELNQHVNDVQEWRNNKNNTSWHTKQPTSQLEKFRKERSAVSVSILRGMIRERLYEDRERDAIYRRQMMTASIANRNTAASTARSNSINSFREVKKQPTGWSLVYNHREALAGIEQPQNDDDIMSRIFMMDKKLPLSQKSTQIASLQMSCIHTLAPFLQQYIDSCGEEYIMERLSLLPSHVITAFQYDVRVFLLIKLCFV